MTQAETLRYIVRPPQTRAAGTLAPVLVFLHGYDEGAPMAIELALTLHGPLRPANPADALAPFLIIAPQLPVRGDVWYRHSEAVRWLVRHAHEQHGGDPERSYLTGFSFGGNGVFDLALLQPHTWAALWAVDPTRVPPRDPQRPVWLSIGEIARARQAQFIRALQLAAPVSDNATDRVIVDEGGDHVGSAAMAYADRRIYRWLLTKRLGDATGSEH